MADTAYIVGDVHGCYSEYLALEALVHEHAHLNGYSPFVVSVGDLIDRGPASADLLEHFLKGSQARTHEMVLGNHEADLLRILEYFKPHNWDLHAPVWPRFLSTLAEEFEAGNRGAALQPDLPTFAAVFTAQWIDQGGRETLASFAIQTPQPATWTLPDPIVNFLLNRPLIWEDARVVASHALLGQEELELLSGNDGSAAPLESLRRASNAALWHRRRPNVRPHPAKLHISGHTPVPQARILDDLGILQVDTGCVFGRSLSAYCSGDGSLLSVPSSTHWHSNSLSTLLASLK